MAKKRGRGGQDHRRPGILGKLEAELASLLDVRCTERQDWISACGNPSGWVACEW
jgi:hypothetical protein